MTTRIETIMPDAPTAVGESGVIYEMHCGFTIETENKDPDYFTNDYPALVKTGPSALIAEQSSWPSTTCRVVRPGPERPGIGHTWYAAPHYLVGEINGVRYKIKWDTEVTIPNQLKVVLEDGDYVFV